jgi:hypothetical protein
VLEYVDVPADLDGVRSYREPGYVFGPFRRGADRAGAVLVTGANRDEAIARAEDAASRIRFTVGSG